MRKTYSSPVATVTEIMAEGLVAASKYTELDSGQSAGASSSLTSGKRGWSSEMWTSGED